ncbi:MAG: OmpH family outer membrane protein [Alphaproteobacteria bacterium]|nr:OmpH family outer membrane protein [Alphaproteobacteria bacterium]
MKKISANLGAIALAVSAVALIGSAVSFCGLGCRKQALEVGTINFAVVREKAKVFQQILAEQQKYDLAVKEKMDKELAPLQTQAEKLEADKAKLTGAEISKQMNALEKKALTIQLKYRPRFERNALASQLALKGIEARIKEAADATRQKTGMSLLLNAQGILSADEAKVDMTNVFVQELDKLVDSVIYPDPAKLSMGGQQ